ncbi:MAG: acetyl-CoA C-acetyltransferase [Planctomycetales bacterium]|nr:acetyl-CoA C-acetyltransferase [Planctomycetales bacterium]
MSDAYVLAGARTPIGKFLGALSRVPATELGASVVRESLRRASVEPHDIDEVILGMVLPAGVGQAPARQAALKAGLPPTVPALTINKMCGSGLKAVMLAAQAVKAGDARIVVAGGMESMSQSPHLLRGARDGLKFGDAKLVDSMLSDGLWCAFDNCHMGSHAEYTARSHGITRGDQDAFAAESQRRAVLAMSDGRFAEEVVSVPVVVKGKTSLVALDESPRQDTTTESLARLAPAFQADGTVTAGNASTISDGAAAVVVANEEVACRSPAPWKARILAYHTSGGEPRDLFVAPVTAIQGALRKANMTVDNIDLFEINEAFAAQMLACIRELRLDPAKVNIHGGAIALGHPIGASGARVLVTLLTALHQRGLRLGVASLCLGGGNAVAMVVERVDRSEWWVVK